MSHSDLLKLKELTPSLVKKNKRRGKELLGTTLLEPPHDKLPREWPGGWTVDWAFDVPDSFADALDIKLMPKVWTEYPVDEQGKKIPRIKDGVPVLTKAGKPEYVKIQRRKLEWTQGSTFSFDRGQIFYDAPEARTMVWKETLPCINTALQIKTGRPADPARVRVRRFQQQPTDIREMLARIKEQGLRYTWEIDEDQKQKPYCLSVFIPRDPGQVVFWVYKRNGTVLKKVEERTVTQDEFIHILINGLDTGADYESYVGNTR